MRPLMRRNLSRDIIHSECKSVFHRCTECEIRSACLVTLYLVPVPLFHIFVDLTLQSFPVNWWFLILLTGTTYYLACTRLLFKQKNPETQLLSWEEICEHSISFTIQNKLKKKTFEKRKVNLLLIKSVLNSRTDWESTSLKKCNKHLQVSEK